MGEVKTRAGALAQQRSSWFLLKALPRMFRQASSEWIDDNAPRLGASVAFYTLLSLAPVIVIAVAVAAVVYGQEAAQGRLASEIQGMAGPEMARTIQEIITGAYQPRTGVIATLLGLAILVFGASSVFVELHDAMNTIWEVRFPATETMPPRRSPDQGSLLFVRGRVGHRLSAAGFSGVKRLDRGHGDRFTAGCHVVILYLVIAVLFAALYKIVPDVELKWSDVALGALIASLFFWLAGSFMGLYFAHASFGSAYSAAGSPMVVLLWVYYSAQLFFWGAEFSKVYTQTVGSQRGRRRSAACL